MQGNMLKINMCESKWTTRGHNMCRTGGEMKKQEAKLRVWENPYLSHDLKDKKQ